ncbi:857_t:CDS:1, partial [Cetraspora pellucida]
QALRQIELNQQKQKERHDQHITATPDFGIGDKVLVYDARRMGTHSRKLIPIWKGSYYVHDVLSNGAYKIRELGGRILAAPINKKLLKPYRERR